MLFVKKRLVIIAIVIIFAVRTALGSNELSDFNEPIANLNSNTNT
jgi:hypothetical protein